MNASWYEECAREIMADPPTALETEARAKASRTGDRRATRTLERQMGATAEIVSQRYTLIADARGIDRDDFRQAAMLAMLQALERWDPSKSQFRTYMQNAAQFAVLDVINTSHVVTINKSFAAAAANNPERKDFAELKPYARAAALQAVSAVSLQSALEDSPHLDPVEREPGYEDAINRVSVEQMFHKTNLKPEEKRAVKARYRMDGETIQDYRQELGVSEQRVGKLATTGVSKLKQTGRRAMVRRLAS